MKFFQFLGEFVDFGEDPLQSEQKSESKNRENKIMKYPCDKCDYSAKIAGNLS